jgi:hypothetical protein
VRAAVRGGGKPGRLRTVGHRTRPPIPAREQPSVPWATSASSCLGECPHCFVRFASRDRQPRCPNAFCSGLRSPPHGGPPHGPASLPPRGLVTPRKRVIACIGAPRVACRVCRRTTRPSSRSATSALRAAGAARTPISTPSSARPTTCRRRCGQSSWLVRPSFAIACEAVPPRLLLRPGRASTIPCDAVPESTGLAVLVGPCRRASASPASAAHPRPRCSAAARLPFHVHTRPRLRCIPACRAVLRSTSKPPSPPPRLLIRSSRLQRCTALRRSTTAPRCAAAQEGRAAPAQP